MMTLKQFEQSPQKIPSSAAWLLADLGEAKGKQELFARQSPQRLRSLREHAMIESTVSSNRIEGIQVERKRVGTIVFGRAALRDRDEEEVRGYRDALKLIHSKGRGLPVSEKTILLLHRLSRGGLGDAGQLKIKDSDIIEKYPDGRVRVRFQTVKASQTPAFLKDLVKYWGFGLRQRWVHPLILLAGFNLDFLCIHPFRDGNGRVSRLLLLLQCYHLGYEVGRYMSIERTIEQNKQDYYESLEESSRGWHSGKHNPWPYVNYLLFVLKEAYREFEQRAGSAGIQRGAKTEIIVSAINRITGPFSVADILTACPGVSVDLVRRTLKNLRSQRSVKCLRLGRDAQWQKT
jgi:Fic family protein